MALRVGLVGATGYTGLEVARLLLRHPDADLVVATSRNDAGKPLSAVHPLLAGRSDVVVEEFDPESMAARTDVVLCCLPHGASAETVHQLFQHGSRVIDFSADFRLSDLSTYEHWYGVKHPWPDQVGQTVYGLPEFFAEQIKDAAIVANPGCYPTSAILPLTPLIQAGLIEPTDIIVDSKSGVSGAGRSAKLATLYCETNESITAYGAGDHRHQPEMEDLVQRISGQEISVFFTPHLTPMERGILSTIYCRPTPKASVEDIQDCWVKAYQDCPFVNAVDHYPATKNVSGTNQVQMTARLSGQRLVLLCAIDNLIKGASGAAIQNMNVMFGLDETLGLN